MFLMDEPTALSPVWEMISIGLETLAFFMVTVELYGEKRLRRLNARIGGCLKWLAGKVRGAPLEENDELFIYIGSATGTIGHLVLGIGAYFATRAAYRHLATTPLTHVLTLLWWGYWLICSVPLTVALLLLPLDFIVIVLRGILWVVAKLKLRGILLAIGTVLFLLSRAIPFLHALNERRFLLPWPLKLL